MSLGRDGGYEIIEYWDESDEQTEAVSLGGPLPPGEETTKDWGPFFRAEISMDQEDPRDAAGIPLFEVHRQRLVSTAFAGEVEPPWRCGRGIAFRRKDRTVIFGIWYRRKPPKYAVESTVVGLDVKAKKIRRW